MFAKKVFLWALWAFFSSFSAFEDPFEADQASQQFVKNHPTFPANRMVTVISYKEGEKNLAMGSGVALSPYHILTSCHHNYILDEKTAVWVTLAPGDIPINPKNANLDPSKAQKDESFYYCTNRYRFSKVTTTDQDEPVSAKETTIDQFLESVRQTLSTHDFSIRNGQHVINTPNDVLLLKLEKPLAGIKPIVLSSTFNITNTTTVYGVGPHGVWHFADGQKSMNGRTFMDKTPLPKIFEQPDHRLSPMAIHNEEGIYGRHRPQVFVHTLRTVPGKPKAFSCFERLNADDDESFKKQPSLAYHDILPEEQALFGPCVGGMSGCPVFTKKGDEFSLFGLMSCSLPLSFVKPSNGEATHLTLNVFQTFTPELVEKINKVMARPEPEAAAAKP